MLELWVLWFYFVAFALALNCNQNIYVKSQGDLETISLCGIYQGDIFVNMEGPVVDFGGLKELRGTLYVHSSSGIVHVRAPMLTSVHGRVEMVKLTAIERIDLPALTSANALILLQCAQLQYLNLQAGIRNLLKLSVSDTSLRDLSGFYMKTINSLDINNNKYLINFNMSDLIAVRGPLTFTHNGQIQNRKGISVFFPSLETCGDLTIQSVSHLDMSKLKNITGQFDLSLTNLNNLTLKSLIFIASSLSIYNNTSLSNINFPSLVTIGGTFLLSNNPALSLISGFPSIVNIGGSISWTGAFTQIALPNINDIKGTVTIISSSALTCPSFTKSAAIVQGANPVCKSSSDADASGSSGSKKGGSTGFIQDLNFLFMINVFCIVILRLIN